MAQAHICLFICYILLYDSSLNITKVLPGTNTQEPGAAITRRRARPSVYMIIEE
jgi:hypothetical protein